jgi:ATP-dependent Clp endopeptidase proteolytic subunit ClpP
MKDYKLNDAQEDKEGASEEEEHSTIHFSLPQGSSEKNLRTVAIFGEINEEKSADITSGIYYLWKNAPEPYTDEELEEDEELEQVDQDIKMIVSTYGGEVLEMFAIYDMMQMAKSDGIDIQTMGIGKVMSAGVAILAAGTKGKRKVSKNCRLMLHQASAGTMGSVYNMENELEEVKVLQDMYVRCVADNSNLSITKIKKMFKTNANHYISAEKAVEYGIADEVV